MARSRSLSLTAGFSLLELVVVLAILATLTGLVVPYVAVTMRIERTDATIEFMDRLEQNIEDYGRDLLTYPATLDDLLSNVAGLEGWRGPYAVHRFSATGTSLSGDVRQDAWNEDLLYTRFDASRCRLRSKGDDREAGTDDDIVKDLDLHPTLWVETRERLETLNDAIASYNRTNLPDSPLPTDFPALRGRLITQHYLPDSSWHAVDAWGDPFVVDPPGVTPPIRVKSIHDEGAADAAAIDEPGAPDDPGGDRSLGRD